MKKKNGHVLEYEPGTMGDGIINAKEITLALNAWAARRGIVWESAFATEKRRWAAKKASRK